MGTDSPRLRLSQGDNERVNPNGAVIVAGHVVQECTVSKGGVAEAGVEVQVVHDRIRATGRVPLRVAIGRVRPLSPTRS